MQWWQASAEDDFQDEHTTSFSLEPHKALRNATVSIENAAPEKNEVAFKWFNYYAGVAIKTPSKTLVIDPVDVKAKSFASLDAILITHEHYDHLDEPLIRKIQDRTQCRILADPTSARRLSNSIPAEKVLEMEPGTEAKMEDVTIRAEQCNHPPASTPITFLITSEDGVKIFHTADSSPFPEMKDIGDKHKPDLVFCTVGIAPGASPRTGMEIAKLLKPKVAVPYHAASREDLEEFCRMLKKEKSKATCLIPEQGRVYIVGKERRT